MLREALILAGGLGTRLGELTLETPKPILPVDGEPFMRYLLWNLARQGVRRAVLSTGYLAEKVEAVLGDGSDFGLELSYAVETEALGTGGAIRFAAEQLGDRFYVLNGDTLFDANLPALNALAIDLAVPAAIAMRAVEDVSRYGRVLVDDAGRMTEYAEKSASGPGWISGGIYVLEKHLLERLPEGPCSVEKSLFPDMVSERKVAGMPSNGYFVDIGLPETLAAANEEVPKWRNKQTVFLDRDGVLNVNHGWVHTPEEFDWIEGAPQAVRWLNDKGYLVILITNQAGIARGKYSEKTFLEFTDWMQDRLAEHGAHLDAVYYCPNHPVHGLAPYNVECGRRKPAPGMLIDAIRDWKIDPAKAVMIGDKPSDMEAAETAGVRGHLFEGGNLLEFLQRI